MWLSLISKQKHILIISRCNLFSCFKYLLNGVKNNLITSKARHNNLIENQQKSRSQFVLKNLKIKRTPNTKTTVIKSFGGLIC